MRGMFSSRILEHTGDCYVIVIPEQLCADVNDSLELWNWTTSHYHIYAYIVFHILCP